MENKLTTSEIRSVCQKLSFFSDIKTRETAAQAIGQLLDEVKFLTNTLKALNDVIDGLDKVIGLQGKILAAKPSLPDFMRGA